MHNLSLQIATKLIRDILSVGYVVNIWDTETFALDAPSDSLQVILAHLGQTDQETVLVYATAEGTNPPFTEIQLIYDPDDPTSVIADYYTAANKLTAGAEALAEALETQPDNTRLIALIENAPVWRTTGHKTPTAPATTGNTNPSLIRQPAVGEKTRPAGNLATNAKANALTCKPTPRGLKPSSR